MSRDQEMTYEEIAQEIDLSVKSVEYHMTKALAHMRHKLKDYLILLCFGLTLYSLKSKKSKILFRVVVNLSVYLPKRFPIIMNEELLLKYITGQGDRGGENNDPELAGRAS